MPDEPPDALRGDLPDEPADELSASESSDPKPAASSAGPPRKPVRHRFVVHISAGVLIVVLTALLGFAIVVQVHQNAQTDNLANLRDDDLVGILDDQNARADRLRQEIAQLQRTLRELHGTGDRSAAAREQARRETNALGVLLGTLPAHGPGVTVTVTDPHDKLDNEDLLDVVEELRGAGAEAIQFGSVRVSTDTAFSESGGQVLVDGTVVRAPYTVLAIGDPKTMDTALNIPGGVADAVRNEGDELSVHEQRMLSITATRALKTPHYAQPSGH